jgi:exosortase/archaeosortase family protein
VTVLARRAWLGIAAVVAVVVGGAWLGREAARRLEADLTVHVLRALGGRVASLTDHSILVVPADGTPFRVIVTASCSALAPVLALFALTLVAGRGAPPRRLLAAGVAATVVVVGNLVRIAASVGVGLWTGRSSLVLFHDVVGSVFGVGYTLFGYLLVVALLLPRRASARGAEPLEVRDGLLGC